ncbi:MAG: conjugal transfer protein TraF [Desulfurivibrionaceae bacterium]
MQKRLQAGLSTTLIFIACSGTALAAPSSYTPIGPNIGYGDSSNPNSLYSALANPANNDLNAADIEGSRYGLGAAAQIQAETDGLEDSKDFLDDQIKPILDRNDYEDAELLQEEVNKFLRRYDRGNFSAIGGATVPLIIKNDVLGGGISFDYTHQRASKGEVIRKDDVSATLRGTDIGLESGDAAIAIHYKELDEFALGYGRSIIDNNHGRLSVGVTARYLGLLSNARAIDLSEIADDNLGAKDKDTGDYIDDIDSGSSESGITADIGINWTSENYMIGLVGMNLNSPEFDVQDKSTGNANTAFAIEDKFELEAQYRLNAQWFSQNRNWTLAGSLDLQEANDLNDEETQWWTISASYATSTWYVPDVRLGLRGNLAGSEYTYGTLGLTLGFLTMDVASTTTDFSGVADDQEDAGIMASVGVEFDF